MNKSKFLKKSLAMLLALMLVLAMIPLSASAAEGEYGDNPTITVDGAYPELSGTTYTVEAASTTVTLGEDAPYGTPDGTEVVFIDKDGKDITLNAANQYKVDLTKYAKVDGSTYTLDVEMREPQETDDDPIVTKYTLAITVNEAVKGSNTAIAYLKELTNMAEYEIGADTITITYKFNSTLENPTTGKTGTFQAADPEVTSVDYVAASGADGQIGTVTVVAADGATKKTYTVKSVMRSGLKSFTVPEQIGETEIDDSAKTIDITVPYGYEMAAVIPTFELGEDVVAMSEVANTEIKSDETELDFETTPNTHKHKIYLWTEEIDDSAPSSAYVEYTVTLTEAPNTAGVLESIQVVDSTQNKQSNVTEVTGNSVTVEMPKGYDFSKGTGVTLNLTGSDNAAVKVLAQPTSDQKKKFDGDGEATITKVDISSKQIKLQVISAEEDSEVNEYTITFTAAAADATVLENFIIKADVDQDGTPESYEMDEDYTVTLPYAARALGAANFTVYVSASTGAKVVGNDKSTTVDTKKLSDNALLGAGNLAGKDGTDIQLYVQNAGNQQPYTIKLAYEDARSARTVTKAELVGTSTFANIEKDNTYAASTSTAKMKVGTKTETVQTIRVVVPYSYGKNDTTSPAQTTFSTLDLSDGAVAFVDNGGTVSEIKVLTKDETSATTITVPTNALDKDGYLTSSATTVVYVVSEKVYVDNLLANKTVTSTMLSKLDATKYYVCGVSMEAQTAADLISIDSTLDENISVTLNDAKKEIEIAVPHSYPGSSPTEAETFSLTFQTSAMATVKANTTTPTELQSDLGSEETKGRSQFIVGTGGKMNVLGTSTSTPTVIGNFDKITVYSEDYTATPNPAGKSTTYDVVVKVNDPEEGAELLSVGASGVTATPDANKDVNLTLPYGSTKYPVELELEVSKLATVTVNGDAYNPEKGYDLNADVKIVVTSEKGDTHTEYTLKTTVAENFFDVAKDQWYYDEVLKAAENKWVNGTKPGYFEPNGTMTRGDFALIIARIKNYNPALYTESAFPDVESTDYYSAAIAYCKEMGYLGGENGYFNPKDPITREEMAKIICNAAGVKQVTDPTSPYADDDTIAEWAKGYVYGCQAAEIMMGDENANTFDARSNATRAEAAAVLVRAFA